MKFGYLIIYVKDVEASLKFFSSAFGLGVRFIHESGTYGELETGETALAFAADELAASNFSTGHVPAHSSLKPLGIEVGLVTEDVPWPMPKRFKQAPAKSLPRLPSPGGKPCLTFDALTERWLSCVHP